MKTKKIFTTSLILLLIISFSYGLSSIFMSGLEYEAEKNNVSKSTLNNISEIKDYYIHDIVEEQVTNLTRLHFDNVDRLTNN